GHVVLLVWIHREVVHRADGTEVSGGAEPRVLGRVEILPRDFYPGLLGIATDIDAHAIEALAVNVDPGVARGVLRLAEDVGTIVDAVEVDRLPVVVHHLAGGRRLEADHGSQRGPEIDVRHHFVVSRAGWDVSRPPHQAWHAPTTFKGGGQCHPPPSRQCHPPPSRFHENIRLSSYFANPLSKRLPHRAKSD